MKTVLARAGEMQSANSVPKAERMFKQQWSHGLPWLELHTHKIVTSVNGEEKEISVQGMHCTACAAALYSNNFTDGTGCTTFKVEAIKRH